MGLQSKVHRKTSAAVLQPCFQPGLTITVTPGQANPQECLLYKTQLLPRLGIPLKIHPRANQQSEAIHFLKGSEDCPKGNRQQGQLDGPLGLLPCLPLCSKAQRRQRMVWWELWVTRVPAQGLRRQTGLGTFSSQMPC